MSRQFAFKNMGSFIPVALLSGIISLCGVMPLFAGSKDPGEALMRTRDKIGVARTHAVKAHTAYQDCCDSLRKMRVGANNLEKLKLRYAELVKDTVNLQGRNFADEDEASAMKWIEERKREVEAKNESFRNEFMSIRESSGDGLRQKFNQKSKEFLDHWKAFHRASTDAWAETFVGDSANKHHREAVEIYFNYFGVEGEVEREISKASGLGGGEVATLVNEYYEISSTLTPNISDTIKYFTQYAEEIGDANELVTSFLKNWDPFEKVEVRYLNSDGAEIFPKRRIRKGSVVEIPEPIEKTKQRVDIIGLGYDFLNWSTSRDGAADVAGKVVEEPMTLWLVRKELPVEVIFHNDDGSNFTAPTQIYRKAVNNILEIPVGEPTKYGYKFAGWSLGKKNGTRADVYNAFGRSVEVAVPWTMPNNRLIAEFYPVWIEDDISIIFKDRERGIEVDVATRTTTISGNVPNVMVPAREGYEALGWRLEDNTKVAQNAAVSTILPGSGPLRVTLFADRKAIERTVQFLSRTSVSNATPERIGTAVGSIEKGVTAPKLPKIQGYQMKEWRKDGDETPFDFRKPLTENLTLVAVWEAVPRSVTLHSGDAQNDYRPENGRWTIEIPFVEPPVPVERKYCDFICWTVAPPAEGNDYVLTDTNSVPAAYVFGAPLLEDLDLFAVWRKRTCTVTFGSITKLDKNKVEIFQGETIDVPTPEPVVSRRRFVGWFEQDPVTRARKDTPYDFSRPVEKNLRLVAHFEYDESYVPPSRKDADGKPISKVASKSGKKGALPTLGGNTLGIDNRMVWLGNAILVLAVLLVFIKLRRRR